jgi:hypothetical protein
LQAVGWAKIWAIFSQTHLVTLDTTQVAQKQSEKEIAIVQFFVHTLFRMEDTVLTL